jgi:Sap, sulfolipid-1-addressing protein
MDSILFWAFAAAFNPTLLAASTVMLLLDHPKRLLLGYLAGATLTSVTLGMVIVFALDGSSGATSTTQNTLSPAADFALGGILLVVAYAIRPGRVPREEGRLADRRRRRAEAKEEKGPPKWQQYLSRGTARTTFVVGVLLTLPGASYLIGLNDIADKNSSTIATIAMVLGFNVIMLMLLEIPLISYTLAPDWTPDAVDRFKAWFNRNSKKFGFRLAGGVGILLIVRGVIELL